MGSEMCIRDRSGYVPLDKASCVRSIYGANDITLSTIYTDLQGISHKTRQKGIMIKTDVYRDGKKHSTKILAEGSVHRTVSRLCFLFFASYLCADFISAYK